MVGPALARLGRVHVVAEELGQAGRLEGSPQVCQEESPVVGREREFRPDLPPY